MTLYEINEKIEECVDSETGEIIDEEMLNALMMSEEEKIENIALWIKNLDSDAEALKKEAQSLTERKRVAENKRDSLKRYLSSYLDGKKFSTTKVAISWRKSQTLEETEFFTFDNIPKEYIKTTYELKKKDLKDAINKGLEVKGVKLVDKNNIQIK